jgi:phosphoribosylformimino-5-aminoimidazole carboxamide ribotide isomerase
MTRFRPCIDLHAGQVKQIVGGTLTTEPGELRTNFISTLPAGHYAKLYRQHNLTGGHVVMLGPGNEDAAKEALTAWPGRLHIAGGITDRNAQYWIDAGAEKVGCPTLFLQYQPLFSFLVRGTFAILSYAVYFDLAIEYK